LTCKRSQIRVLSRPLPSSLLNETARPTTSRRAFFVVRLFTIGRNMFRRLRIAASVFFALVAIALCVLWVRSYWHFDQIEGQLFQRNLFLASASGQIRLSVIESPKPVALNLASSRIEGDRVGLILTRTDGTNLWLLPLFVASLAPTAKCVWMWYLLPTFLVIVLSALPWIHYLPRRFSLRTMLIAATLIALTFGMVLYLIRQ
jgi:hypothetical protein